MPDLSGCPVTWTLSVSCPWGYTDRLVFLRFALHPPCPEGRLVASGTHRAPVPIRPPVGRGTPRPPSLCGGGRSMTCLPSSSGPCHRAWSPRACAGRHWGEAVGAQGKAPRCHVRRCSSSRAPLLFTDPAPPSPPGCAAPTGTRSNGVLSACQGLRAAPGGRKSLIAGKTRKYSGVPSGA